MMIRILRIFFLPFLMLTFSKATLAQAETQANWAWPGAQFDIITKDSIASCSVGYPAWDDAGNRYFITAGHCFRDDQGRHYTLPGKTGIWIYAPNDPDDPVGYERVYFPPYPQSTTPDISVVEMLPGQMLMQDGWAHIPDFPRQGQSGDRACLVGFRHVKSNCGHITATNIKQLTPGFDWTEVVDSADYCSHSGDSGGAVYNREGALGINVNGVPGRNEPGTPGDCISDFIPIVPILSAIRESIPSFRI